MTHGSIFNSPLSGGAAFLGAGLGGASAAGSAALGGSAAAGALGGSTLGASGPLSAAFGASVGVGLKPAVADSVRSLAFFKAAAKATASLLAASKGGEVFKDCRRIVSHVKSPR